MMNLSLAVKLKVILASFLILFLELALIRFLPANILYFGFFTNFILLASFFGIGVGFLLAHSQKNLISLFPFFLALLIVCSKLFATGLQLDNNDLIFFKDSLDNQPIAIPSFILLPLFYVLISLVFISLSQILATFFSNKSNLLKLYVLDILGSILGIWVFFYLSNNGIPPVVWFSLISILYLILVFNKNMSILLLAFLLIISTLLTIDFEKDKKVFWSPYYKLSLVINDMSGGGLILANNVHHQYFSTTQNSLIYTIFFNIIRSQAKLDDVLIIGSGSGQDVNAALHAGAKNIDAVEILDEIYRIGLKYHPEKPYQDPKVKIHITDGRNFLKNTDKKYDVIIFAVTDSLILNSAIGETRLESFLFTKEAFIEVRGNLKDNGLFVLYNDYRKQWLIDRIDQMLRQAFNDQVTQVPITQFINDPGSRLFIAQKSSLNLPKQKYIAYKPNLPSDDWPFLYLRTHSIPPFYLINLFLISLISIITIFLILKTNQKIEKTKFKLLLFFFLTGAAFSLLETKSIVQSGLIFGTTWQVYVFAITGILSAILIGTLFSLKIKLSPILLFFLLILSLFIQITIPVSQILNPNFLMRLILASLYFYLPIFFSNLLFAHLFAKSTNFAQIFLGFNILGLILGGILEYFALISGYSSLVYLVLILYSISFILNINLFTNLPKTLRN